MLQLNHSLEWVLPWFICILGGMVVLALGFLAILMVRRCRGHRDRLVKKKKESAAAREVREKAGAAASQDLTSATNVAASQDLAPTAASSPLLNDKKTESRGRSNSSSLGKTAAPAGRQRPARRFACCCGCFLSFLTKCTMVSVLLIVLAIELQGRWQHAEEHQLHQPPVASSLSSSSSSLPFASLGTVILDNHCSWLRTFTASSAKWCTEASVAVLRVVNDSFGDWFSWRSRALAAEAKVRALSEQLAEELATLAGGLDKCAMSLHFCNSEAHAVRTQLNATILSLQQCRHQLHECNLGRMLP